MTEATFSTVLATVLIVAGLATSPVAAQGDVIQYDGCTAEAADIETLILPTLDGAWQVSHGAGIAHAMAPGGQQMAIPFPGDSAPETATFAYDDGRVLVSGPDMAFYEVTVGFDAGELGDYGLPTGANGAEQVMDFDALETVPNCSVDLLPMVRWSGELGVPGAAGAANFEVLVHMVNENLMSGVFVVNASATDGTQVHARRFITLRR